MCKKINHKPTKCKLVFYKLVYVCLIVSSFCAVLCKIYSLMIILAIYWKVLLLTILFWEVLHRKTNPFIFYSCLLHSIQAAFIIWKFWLCFRNFLECVKLFDGMLLKNCMAFLFLWVCYLMPLDWCWSEIVCCN